ncbi:HpcH/HpaI aldolase family protein [Arsenicicoccus sp. oral taxon 190]|uniref:HpcH/HpaI aldolase family protein n=1 Tax=Arsenicicoccus sp. oral taxon 190 TaxID=1658671 RepID=UPI000679ED88|nr:aldolase/citrate lyase family protein [Arsenicicoccus sp. oral taxon 190]AKT50250.1 2,4-dihydroxyhept-2-ene-1,7-dioic acid aldolase [Arsenicicoccus sp. oral taxon 190]
MRTNTLRTLLDDGGTAVNGWISGSGIYAAEVLGHVGFDSVTVDAQHGLFGRGELVAMLAALSGTPAVPMVRPSAPDPDEIGWCLDAGAYGLIVPGVDTPQIARAVCDAAFYPPKGTRSFGPGRGLLFGGTDYPSRSHEQVTMWLMIESAAALENLDAILDTSGAYGVYVGPNDLALSLGEPAGGRAGDAVRRIALDVCARAHARGLKAGLFCADGEEAAEFARQGFDLVTPGNDMSLLRASASQRLAQVRNTIPVSQSGGY